MNVMVFGYNFFSVNIHLLYAQYLVCTVNSLADYFQKCSIYSCRIKGFKDHKGTKQHGYAIGKLHCTAQIKVHRRSCNNNSCQLTDKILHTYSRYSSDFRFYIRIFLSVDCLVKPCIVLIYQIVVSYFCDTLYILKYYSYYIFVCFDLFIGYSCDTFVCPFVHKKENKNSQDGNNADPPVKGKHSDTYDYRCDTALQNHNDGSGGDIAHLFHCICRYRGYMPKACIVEIAHRQIPQMLAYFYAFSGTGVVACFGLEHLGKAVDDHFAYCAYKHQTYDHRKGCTVYFIIQHCTYCKKRSRYFHCPENCIKHPKGYRSIKLIPVFFAAKVKEFLQHFKHQTDSFPVISSSLAIV